MTCQVSRAAAQARVLFSLCWAVGLCEPWWGRGVAVYVLGVSASCVGPTQAQQGLHGNQALGFRGNSREEPGNASSGRKATAVRRERGRQTLCLSSRPAGWAWSSCPQLCRPRPACCRIWAWRSCCHGCLYSNQGALGLGLQVS